MPQIPARRHGSTRRFPAGAEAGARDIAPRAGRLAPGGPERHGAVPTPTIA